MKAQTHCDKYGHSFVNSMSDKVQKCSYAGCLATRRVSDGQAFPVSASKKVKRHQEAVQPNLWSTGQGNAVSPGSSLTQPFLNPFTGQFESGL